MFGMADEDWDAYRNISKEQFEEEDEEDQALLNELEEQISDMDPEFPLMLMGKKVATAEDFQMRLFSDRYRPCEVLFQPSIIGQESTGLTEIMENLVS